MAATTKANVLVIAPELSNVSDGLFDLVLNDVTKLVSTSFGKNQEMAQRYLAAHLVTVSSPDYKNRTGPVVRYKLGPEEIEFADMDLKSDEFMLSTKYGRHYQTIGKQSIFPAFCR